MISKHVIVSGRVQGVGYRAWTQRTASQLGLSGWVRNLDNGNVEALIQGKQDMVERMIVKMQKGPLVANVRNLAIKDETFQDMTGFDVKATL